MHPEKCTFGLVIVLTMCGACAHPGVPPMVPGMTGSCRTASVRWLGPDDQEDRTRLDAWCAGVGPVVMASGGTVASRDISPADITFVSWNVHVGHGDITRFVNDLRAGRWTGGRPAGEIVLLLQEVLRRGDVPVMPAHASGAGRIGVKGRAAADIRELARELDMWLVYAPSMRNGQTAGDQSEDRGNAILSTLPLSDALAVELSGRRQRRVALFAKLALQSSDSISVGVLHFDALAGRKQLWLFGSARARALQATSVAAVLPQGTLVLGADLNTWHGAEEPAPAYFRRLFEDTPVQLDRSGPRRRVLDYMFFRASGVRARYRVAEEKYGSDHHPLIGRLQ